jgi:hypothetical protein
MEILKKIAEWLNGKKTIIGLIGTNILQMDLQIIQSMNPDIKTLLLYLFGILAAGGLTHKVLKGKK